MGAGAKIVNQNQGKIKDTAKSFSREGTRMNTDQIKPGSFKGKVCLNVITPRLVEHCLVWETDATHQVLKARICAQAIEVLIHFKGLQLQVVRSVGFLKHRQPTLFVAQRNV